MADSAVQMNTTEITNQLALMGYELTDITAAMHFVRNSQDINYIIDEIEKQQQIISLPSKPILEISKIDPCSVSFSCHPSQPLIFECKSQHAIYMDTDDIKLPNPNNIKWIEYIITDNNASSNDYTLSNLDQCNKYIFRFCLKNKLGWSEWSNICTFETPAGPLFVNLLNPKPYTTKKRNETTEKNIDITSENKSNNSQQIDMRSLKLGDTIDGEDNWKVWYEAKIIDINNEKGLKLKFKNWGNKFDEWISFAEKKRFAKLNTKTLKFYDLCVPKIMIISKPKYYISLIDNKSYMIMICNNIGIVRYDIYENKYELLIEDNIFKDIKVPFISTSMDTIYNIFYIILNMNDIRAFDVNKKQWIIQNINNNQDEKEEECADKNENINFEEMNSVFISHTGKINNNNGFHFIYRINGNENEEEIFYKYYGNTNKSEEIKIIAKDLSNVNYGWGMNRGQFVESNLFYCKELNRILINKTYYEDRGRNYYHKWGYIDLNMNNNELKYRKIEIDMKMNCNKNYILGFGHLLFIFDIRLPQSIYCWDLLTNKYYECLKRFPKAKKNQNGKLAKFKYNILGNNNILHLIDPYNNVHIKFNLFDIIPNELYNEKCYSKNKIKLLINGYLRQFDEFEYQIPKDIIKIICNSYPIFL